MHSSKSVIWDNDIRDYSQKWAEYLIKTNSPSEHSVDTIQADGETPILPTNPIYKNYLKANIINFRSGGENLGYIGSYICGGTAPDTNILEVCKIIIKAWYDEIKDYDFTTHTIKKINIKDPRCVEKKKQNPNLSDDKIIAMVTNEIMIGHFTCLVWNNYNKFGMGYAIKKEIKNNCTHTYIEVTFNTDMKTNIIGEFSDNVKPLFGQQQSILSLPLPTSLPSQPTVLKDTLDKETIESLTTYINKNGSNIKWNQDFSNAALEYINTSTQKSTNPPFTYIQKSTSTIREQGIDSCSKSSYSKSILEACKPLIDNTKKINSSTLFGMAYRIDRKYENKLCITTITTAIAGN